MYIDPGTGGQLATILLMAFGAITGSVLIFSNKIKMFFAKMRRKMREGSGETETETTEPVE